MHADPVPSMPAISAMSAMPAVPARPQMSARSLIHGQGHPSQASRLRAPWRLETSGQVFLVRRATAADLPSVMGALVRSSALSRWQWRRTRGGGVPSMSEMALWLREPGSLVAVAPTPLHTTRPGLTRVRAPRVIALGSMAAATCAGTPAPHVAEIEVLVADPWQGLGVGAALVDHLAAAAWLLGRREVIGSPVADSESAERLLQRFGPLHEVLHPHGPHARIKLSSAVLAGLGPLREARLS
jgi:GNAT superfamily N-acetyltransferase